MTKILILDDNDFARCFLSDVLIDYEYEVQSEAWAQDALDYMKKHSIDILITNIHMPDMECIELIRQTKLLQHKIKILAITEGDSSNFDYLKVAENIGADKVCEKKILSNVAYAVRVIDEKVQLSDIVI